jgi:hypothetical protein
MPIVNWVQIPPQVLKGMNINTKNSVALRKTTLYPYDAPRQVLLAFSVYDTIAVVVIVHPIF